MAPHSSPLAWKIPWMQEPGRLRSMGSGRVGHDWVTSLSLSTFMYWRRKWQPTPVFLPGEPQGWGSLVGCRLWGRTELDMTEVTQQQQHVVWASRVAQMVKDSAHNAGNLCSIAGLGRSPEGRHGNPLQYSCLENPHGQRSLVGYSPWGHRVGHNWATKHSTAHSVWFSLCVVVFCSYFLIVDI